MKVEVISELCPQNHFCPVIKRENCADCGICINYYAYGAITFKN